MARVPRTGLSTDRRRTLRGGVRRIRARLDGLESAGARDQLGVEPRGGPPADRVELDAGALPQLAHALAAAAREDVEPRRRPCLLRAPLSVDVLLAEHPPPRRGPGTLLCGNG